MTRDGTAMVGAPFSWARHSRRPRDFRALRYSSLDEETILLIYLIYSDWSSSVMQGLSARVVVGKCRSSRCVRAIICSCISRVM